MGIFYKVASIYEVSNESFLALNGICWIVFGIIYMSKFEKPININISSTVLKYSLLSGSLVCGIVLFMKLAVELGDASIVITISQLSFLVTFPGSIIFLKERFTLNKLMAIFIAVICIFIFSLEI
ncbi:MAG: hypothetical protein COY53_08460 [Elusimicrobia bacterium CG_4_10_14_0_8_um_filter_37_32]|nr:MAG: hypothetical protein COS17_09955 [Elusimicrobia bacterium CG02_land_8_20_14_3_00_37_13]PIZ12736.1 MAG: hypothetical protein COY53_08460 [Elusimicrobia bacterium CG_4_10_14_0_8_um_filter_37_32]